MKSNQKKTKSAEDIINDLCRNRTPSECIEFLNEIIATADEKIGEIRQSMEED